MLTFPNITPEVFARVLDELRKHSEVTDCRIPPATPSKHAPLAAFLIEGNGIQARAMHQPDNSIEVHINHKPWYISEGMIGGKIRDAITAAQREIGEKG